MGPLVSVHGTARRWSILYMLLVLLYPIASTANDSLVSMTASDDTFTFSPAELVTHVGQQATIQLRSTGGVRGVSSAELGIDTTLIRPNRPVVVSFMPKEAGRYVVHCAYVCGIGHQGMAFAVQVEP
jgi:heme/copper-type cytochrome/quinol oxidase subunit 2